MKKKLLSITLAALLFTSFPIITFAEVDSEETTSSEELLLLSDTDAEMPSEDINEEPENDASEQPETDYGTRTEDYSDSSEGIIIDLQNPVTEKVEVEPGEMESDILPDEETLFAMYADKMFDVDYFEDNTDESTLFFGRPSAYKYLNEVEKVLYDKAVDLITAVAYGETSQTFLTFSPEDLGLEEISRIDVPGLYDNHYNYGFWDYSINEEKRDAAIEKLQSQLQIDREKVLEAICADNPELLYWFGRSYNIGIVGFSENTDGSDVKKTSETTGVSDGYISVSLFEVYFSVAYNYAVQAEGDMYYSAQADITKTSATRTAVANARSIAASCANLDDYEKLLAFKEKICNLVSYNYLASYNDPSSMGSDPWELIYVFDNNPETDVVCEGYSKAFQYLCDISTFSNDVEVTSVVGTMDGGPHKWNIVNFNGKRYLTDVTNCDNSDIENGDNSLFMKGYKSGSVSDGYIITKSMVQYDDFSYSMEQAIKYVYFDEVLRLYANHFEVLTLDSKDFNPDSGNQTDISNGLIDAGGGNWYLYENGNVNTSYCGLYNDENLGCWLVLNGKVAFDYNDAYNDATYGWWKVADGKVDFGFIGNYESSIYGGVWYFENGQLIGPANDEPDISHDTGFADGGDGNWYLYDNGKIAKDFSGLYNDAAFGWWLVLDGRVAFEYDDIYGDATYGWWKVSWGRVDFDFSDLYGSSRYGWWLITNGAVDFGYSDVYNSPSYGYWKVEQGQVDFGFNGVYNSQRFGQFYVENGAAYKQ